MKKNFEIKNWKNYIPIPVDEKHAEYIDLYYKAWELAYEHIKYIPDMPQNPYMDEAFCETQIWIWDTCFMSLFCKYAKEVFPGVESLKNFYDVLYENKSLPTVIPPKNEPDWTEAKPGEPYEIKIHIADNPPLFAWSEYENALFHGDKKYIKELLETHNFLQKHYNWLESLHKFITPKGVLNNTCLISEKDGYKWEGGRSGMDNTPRGRKGMCAEAERPNNPDMLWIDAICQQAMSALMIAKLYAIIEDKEQEIQWMKKHDEKKKIINSLYWDEQDGFYYDIDCYSHEFYKVMTIASYWTLISETANEEQAKMLVNHLKNPNEFGGFVPLISLARNDSDYSKTGSYWRGALWLPTAYMTLKGMIKYGFFDEARSAAAALLEHMYRTYTDYTPHTIWECYNPEKYEPSVYPDGIEIVRKDFCGWSALGPISVYIEFVLGFYEIDAFKKTVRWAKPKNVKSKIGIKNLRFGDIVTNIVAKDGNCLVIANSPYTLKINDKSYAIESGENVLQLE